MFTPRILKNAARQPKKLDPPVARRIVDQIRWVSAHFEETAREPLKGDLSGLFKLREGDYRIFYEVIHEEKVIVVHEIGHRSDIDKKHRR